MKTLTILLGLTMLLSNAIAGHGQEGGDPIPVNTIDFPNEDLLNKAITIAQEKIKKSRYGADLKHNLTKELQLLSQEKAFRYIPSKVLLTPHNSNYTSMVSVGAITQSGKGSIVYLTEQVKNYSANKRVKVILQELPHHTLFGEFAHDEKFINSLGTSIFNGDYKKELDDKLIKASRLEIYMGGSWNMPMRSLQSRVDNMNKPEYQYGFDCHLKNNSEIDFITINPNLKKKEISIKASRFHKSIFQEKLLSLVPEGASVFAKSSQNHSMFYYRLTNDIDAPEYDFTLIRQKDGNYKLLGTSWGHGDKIYEGLCRSRDYGELEYEKTIKEEFNEDGIVAEQTTELYKINGFVTPKVFVAWYNRSHISKSSIGREGLYSNALILFYEGGHEEVRVSNRTINGQKYIAYSYFELD